MADLDAEIRAKFPTATTRTPDLAGPYNALRGTVLAVLDLHKATYPTNEVEYEWVNEPAYDKAGKLIGYVPVNSGPVTPYWCHECDDMQPCATKRAIAEGLGIEVQA